MTIHNANTYLASSLGILEDYPSRGHLYFFTEHSYVFNHSSRWDHCIYYDLYSPEQTNDILYKVRMFEVYGEIKWDDIEKYRWVSANVEWMRRGA